MAKFTSALIFEKMTGRFSSFSDFIMRLKHARDEEGNIIWTREQEIFKRMHKRDWKKTPAKGEEKVHFDLWTEACKRAAKEMQPTHERYAYWRERWRAQLHTPDPECEVNKKTKKKQCYYQFDCFVRVAILWELRKQVNA